MSPSERRGGLHPTNVAEHVQPEPETETIWTDFCTQHPEVDRLEVLLPDTNGIMRGKWLPRAHGTRAWRPGVALPRSLFAVDVWGREVVETGLHLESGDRDGLCRAVPASLSLSVASDTTAQVLLTMRFEDAPCLLDPRVQLERALARVARLGLTPVVAFEMEFYLLDPEAFAQGQQLTPALGRAGRLQNMYAISDLEQLSGFFDTVRTVAAQQNLAIDTMLSEAAPGQYEINLLHRADGLRAADEAVLLRRAISAAADRHGMLASFMPKPFIDQPGSGMHVHISLQDATGRNAFSRGDEGMRQLHEAVAGLLKTMPDLALMFVPSFNGFRRLQSNSYAPTSPSWGHDNRSVAVRIPGGEASARRLEHRISGADANPYLVLAALLHGMAEGLERGLRPPEPVKGSAYALSAGPLPVDMREAITNLRRSAFAAESFGADYVDLFTKVKAAEFQRFQREITPLEVASYLR